LLVALMMIFAVGSLPDAPSEAKQEEIKQEMVKIVKAIPPPPPKTVNIAATMSKDTPVESVQKKSTNSLKRMGALSALGSLSKSNQRGGLDLGAVNTTAGPGLGGT